MCRWVTLLSTEPLMLSDVVLAPSNSMIHQARDATYHPGYDAVNNAPLNADGFGVGWYHANVAKLPQVVRPAVSADGTTSAIQVVPVAPVVVPPVPNAGDENNKHPPQMAALFRDVFPAWNNLNLRELCLATSSDCIMAHIRAASPGSGVSIVNCHPFKAGRLLFCHNGRVFGYQTMRRYFLSKLSDEAFLHLKGTTDSEGVFGLILTILGNDAAAVAQHGSPLHQTAPFGAARLTAALKKTLATIFQIMEGSGMPTRDYCTCNFALTDGDTMVVTRYCDFSPNIPPPSLYFAFGCTLSTELTAENHESNTATSTTPHSPNRSSKHTSSTSSLEDNDEEDDGAVLVGEEDTASSEDDDENFSLDKILLQRKESKPGKIFSTVDPTKATFIVSSNPLTKGHIWHKVPKNSIMWCTRGKHPELRLLQKKRHNDGHTTLVTNASQ